MRDGRLTSTGLLEQKALSFGSTASLSLEPSPLLPDPPNHAITPNVAKANHIG